MTLVTFDKQSNARRTAVESQSNPSCNHLNMDWLQLHLCDQVVVWRRCSSVVTAALAASACSSIDDRVLFHCMTRSSADADNRLDAFSGQSRSTSMVPFHMLHIVSRAIVCAIVTLSLRRAFFTIFVFKKFHNLEMGVKGHSRSLRVISFDRLCMVSY